MVLFYHEERNSDFFAACENIRKEQGKIYLSVSDIAKQAIHTPANSFYLMEKEIAKILYRIEKGIKHAVKSKAKMEQYKEIERRYYEIKKQYPQYNTAKIAREIASQKAPRFYLTETSAILLYYKLLRSKEFRQCNIVSFSYS